MADAAARLTLLTRLGFAARGLLYIVIALLILSKGDAEDPAGALAHVGQGGGRVLLGLIAVGLLAYGLWRLSDAALNIERHEGGGKGLLERLAAGASGVSHLLLAWQAVRLFRGAAAVAGNGAEDAAQSALGLPGGPVLLTIAGLVLAAAGLFQLVKAARAGFLKHLEPAVARAPWALWTGRAGYAARGLVFILIGLFVAQAGLSARASEAGGMAEALGWLARPWDLLAALGLLGFGIFSLIEARYRMLHDVPIRGVGAGRLTTGRF